MSYGDDRIDDFLIESHENLDGLDREILALEKDPTLAGAIGRIFRTIHTIKGTCGFFGFSKLEAITHAGEDLLSLVRDRKVDVDRDVAAALYSLVDAVRAILGSIEQSRTEGDADHAKLLETLLALQGRAAAPSGPSGKHEGAGGTRESPPREVSPDQQPATPGIADTTLRVNVTLLDGLMNLVGELVLARNQILQLTAPLESRPLLAASQRLDLITSELQEEVTKTRLQPLSILWTRYPRLVHDLALACGKEVQLELEGEETELDKSILEALKAPLMHLLRNAIDHGIEVPGERLAAGKPREGRLSITAHHESGQVTLEITDDGSGMDASLIRRKSIERGIVTPQTAQALSDEDVIGFVFLPGFSTAETVTSVSGRGVGLDIVKTSMERVGGTVHVSTRWGTGTTFRITLPLTLAIIPALIVTTGGERYAIPQACLLEVVRLVGEAARKRVEWIDRAPVYRLRGKLIPLIFLNEELGLPEPGPSGREDSSMTIVVVEAEATRFGLVVDRVNDTEEIVVKPLGRRLKSFSVFAGATILGDGKVALILDPPSLAQRAGLELLQGTKSAAHRSSRDEKTERSRHLLVRSPGGRRLILPLGCVERLEEFPREEIETARGRPAVQYRGGVLPLVQVRDLLGDPHEGPPEPDLLEAASLQVVVHSRGESRIGLIVGSVLDIVDDGTEVTGFADGPGPPGIRVIGGRVTEVLDIESLIPQEGESTPAGTPREETHAR